MPSPVCGAPHEPIFQVELYRLARVERQAPAQGSSVIPQSNNEIIQIQVGSNRPSVFLTCASGSRQEQTPRWGRRTSLCRWTAPVEAAGRCDSYSTQRLCLHRRNSRSDHQDDCGYHIVSKVGEVAQNTRSMFGECLQIT